MKLRNIFLLLISIYSFSSLRAQFTSIVQPTISSFKFVKISPSTNVCIAGGSQFVKSLDQGNSWVETSLGVYGNTLMIYTEALVIDDLTYLMLGNDTYNKNSMILRTVDGGNTWTPIIVSANNSYQYAQSIDINGSVIMVATRNGVWRSIDSGSSFSFIPVTAQNGVQNATSVIYNSTSNSWLWRYENNTTFRSLDNGLTWFPFTISGVQTLNSKVNRTATGLVWENKNSANNQLAHVYDIGNNGQVSQLFSFSNLMISQFDFKEVVELNANELIANDGNYFFLIDRSDSSIEQFTHTLISSTGNFFSEIVDFEISSSFGLAVGDWGALSRFDPNLPFDTKVEANFIVPSQPCPGTQVTLTPLNDNVDSLNWFIDNQLVSSNNSFLWDVPSSSNNFNFTLIVWKNGHADTANRFIQPMPVSPLNTYNQTANLFPCYGVPKTLYFDFTSGSTVPGSKILAMFQGDTIGYSSPAPNYDFLATTPPIYTTDSVMLIISRPQPCGYVLYDTTYYVVTANLDLTTQFQYIPGDSLLCSSIPNEIIFTSLTDGLNYTLQYNTSYFTNATQQSVFTNISDTVNVPLGNFNSYFPNYTPSSPGFYIKFYLKVTQSNGCTTNNILIDSLLLIKPHAEFQVSPQASIIGDTLNVINLNDAVIQTWSISNPLFQITNENSFTPNITSSVVGESVLTLNNLPLQTCVDSAFQKFYFGNQALLLEQQICSSIPTLNAKSIVKVVHDNLGNSIEVGVIEGNGLTSANTGIFQIVKRDSGGNLLWIKSPNFLYINNSVVLIEHLVLDANNDIYATIRCRYNGNYNYQMLQYFYQYSSNVPSSEVFLVKIDGNTGDLIWSISPFESAVNAGYLPNGMVPAHYSRVTDLEIGPTAIHLSTESGIMNIDFFGNVFSIHDYLLVGDNYYFHGVSNSLPVMATITSPEIEVLENGEIIMAFTGRSLYFEDTTFTTGFQSDDYITVLAKYDPFFGFSDYKVVAIGRTVNGDLLGKVCLRHIGNKVILGVKFVASVFPLNFYNFEYTLLDSVMDDRNMTYIVQFDEDFNEIWANHLTNCNLTDVSVNKQNGDIYLTGVSTGNLGYVESAFVKVIGENGRGSNTSSNPFIVKLNETGSLQSARLFYNDLPSNFNISQLRISVNPCGDLLWYFRRGADNDTLSLVSYSDTLEVIKTNLVYLRSNCSPQQCDFASAFDVDTLFYCAGNTSVVIPLNFNSASSFDYYRVDGGVPQSAISSSSNVIAISSNTEAIVVLSPVSKTYFLQEQFYDATYHYDSLLCSDSLYSIIASPLVNNYFWQPIGSSQYYIGDSIDFYSSYSLGDSIGPFSVNTKMINPKGCSFNDTLHFYLDRPVYSVSPSNINLICNESYSVPIDNVDYSSQSWQLNGGVSQNQFSGLNLVNGQNLVDFQFTSVWGCPGSQEFQIDYDCINTSSILEPENTVKIHVGPNPTNGDLYVNSDENILIVSVYSIQGELVSEFKDLSASSRISIEGASGLYLVTVETENKSYKFNIVKN